MSELSWHAAWLLPVASPVIFMTAFSDEGTRAMAQCHCIAYLHKPFAANLLIGAIEMAAP